MEQKNCYASTSSPRLLFDNHEESVKYPVCCCEVVAYLGTITDQCLDNTSRPLSTKTEYTLCALDLCLERSAQGLMRYCDSLLSSCTSHFQLTSWFTHVSLASGNGAYARALAIYRARAFLLWLFYAKPFAYTFSHAGHSQLALTLPSTR